MKLKDILAKGSEAIAAASFILGQKLDTLDCAGVETIAAEELALLLSKIPPEWDLVELAEIFQQDTLTEAFSDRLIEAIDRRLGRTAQILTPTSNSVFDPHTLDIFSLRNEVVAEYRNYIESFLKIRDPQVQQFVDRELERGHLWPDPLMQLNPFYKQGSCVTELVQRGVLHPDCEKYFVTNKGAYRFRYHQEQAFLAAQRQEPYVLTTGTGSGKSMTYVVPIFDDLLRHPEVQGVRAILVYPMNALINSQKQEFDKFLAKVPGTSIRVEQYTGQESLQKKTEIQNHPPHILLTNYVMLELMLTRTYEEKLVTAPDLKFLVLDELHTYRGRQGADVALLIRKLRQRCGKDLLCIGTSATMSTEGDRDDRRQTVAGVASKLFGVQVKPSNVIDETLDRSIQRPQPTTAELRTSIQVPTSDQTLEAFKQHPLAAWIEMTFGLAVEGDRLVRRTPISLEAGATQLAAQTQLSVETCQDSLKQMFLWGSKTGGLAFRLHQFISQGGSVYATVEAHCQRFLTLEGQYSTTGDRLLYPLVFCRECGQDYYVVRYDADNQVVQPLLPTALDNDLAADIKEGYLTLDEPDLWSEEDEDRLPDTWFKETKREGRVPKKEYLPLIPQRMRVLPNGKVTTSLLEGTTCWFVRKPFSTCLHCGVVHDGRKNEFTKLSRLSSEGRSTATTLLCLSTVGRLKTVLGDKAEAAKVLSFTDNRQDASLQAGHFNDFVQTSLLRSALNSALQEKQTLNHAELAQEVFNHLQLEQADYARQVAEFDKARQRDQETFCRLLEYRLYEDLRRGWRIVQPNLEQCGLLAIAYQDLKEACAVASLWQDHHILRQATPDQRYGAAKALLDHLRRELAIDANLLQPERLDQLKREVRQAIAESWAFGEFEQIRMAAWATWEASWASSTRGNGTGRSKDRAKIKLTPKSKIGRFLRSPRAWSWLNVPLSDSDCTLLIQCLLNALCGAGFLVKNPHHPQEVQLRIDSLVWQSEQLDRIPLDPLSSRRLQGDETTATSVNQFFQSFYQASTRIRNLEGREHTGQVRNEDRQKREDQFRKGELAALFCSPTMELGIDISDLNVVHMRNVPPSPANYAQRSGRAGRSGQGALVITYASVGSGHDQYFFRRQNEMVAGVVVPPKLELGNPDLVKSHIYSIWLAHTGLELGDSMNQLLDLDREEYPLKDAIRERLTLTPTGLQNCLQAVQSVLADRFCQQDLERSWNSADWIRQTLEQARREFDRAGDRWRELYRQAVIQREKARQIIDRAARGSATKEERDNADAQEREARRQIDLLVGQMNRGRSQNEFEFYPYRYFAAEGFLPGYNFPRLPVRAYIPAGDQGEFVSRPRIVALREFAPSNIVYYEGSKFQISRTRVPVGGVEYLRVGACFNCGYFHEGEDWQRETCVNCGAKIADSHGDRAKLNRVLKMETTIARRRERITCDEEERLKYGYNVTTHFRYASQKRHVAQVKDRNGAGLLTLSYGETATLWRINRGLKRTQERGFKLDTKTGLWGDAKTEQATDIQNEIHLMVEDTCNILVVEPENVPQEDAAAFLATLQYALERAIQAVYKLEDDELCSERLGQGKHLLFWEASEGGAGVLSQIMENPDAFGAIAQSALDICHFVHEKKSCAQACYECLLSYGNQFDHPLLNRHLIHPWLQQLLGSTIGRRPEGDSREQQYQLLRQQTDPNSEFERVVLDEIYRRGFKLPDVAQYLIPEANCKPDFLYQSARIAIFCDGSVHDRPDQRQQDRIARDNLEYSTNYSALTLRHDEDWQRKLAVLPGLVG